MKIGAGCKRGIKYRGIVAVICLCAALLFLWKGNDYGETANTFFGNVTIRAEGGTFDTGWIREMIRQNDSLTGNEEAYGEQERDSETFAAWTELENETISDEMGGKIVVSDVIAVDGPSYCLLPIGKNLFPQDVNGCIIGRELAEELLGSCRAEGQPLLWRGKTWTVRGVVEEPTHLFMVQTSGLGETMSFDRISIVLSGQDDRRLTGERFVNRYGLSARTLRFDHCYGFRWLTELIPARWSDFDGWKQNWEQHRQAVSLVESSEKSCIEAVGIRNYKKRNIFFVLSFIIFFLTVKNEVKKGLKKGRFTINKILAFYRLI